MIAERIRSGLVEISLSAADAQEIILVEDSDSGAAHVMQRQPDGRWTCRLRLPDGVYRFHCRIDGRWTEECKVIGMPEESFSDPIIR